MSEQQKPIKLPTLEEIANNFITWEQVKTGLKEDPNDPTSNEILTNAVINPETEEYEKAWKAFYGEESPIRKRNYANSHYKKAEKQFTETMDSQYKTLLGKLQDEMLVGLIGMVPAPKTEDEKLSKISKAIKMITEGKKVRESEDIDQMEKWGFNNLYSDDDDKKIAKKYGANREVILRGYGQELEGQRLLQSVITKEVKEGEDTKRVIDRELVTKYIQASVPALKGNDKLTFYKNLYGLANAQEYKK